MIESDDRRYWVDNKGRKKTCRYLAPHMEAGITVQASMSTRLKRLVILAFSPQVLGKYRNKELSVRLFSLGVMLVSSQSALLTSERCDSRIDDFDFSCEACILRCAHLLGDFPRYRTILCASRHTEI